jgi:hypothetical protein
MTANTISFWLGNGTCVTLARIGNDGVTLKAQKRQLETSMEETTNGRKNKKNKARDNKTKERIRQVTRQQMEETTNGRNNSRVRK